MTARERLQAAIAEAAANGVTVLLFDAVRACTLEWATRIGESREAVLCEMAAKLQPYGLNDQDINKLRNFSNLRHLSDLAEQVKLRPYKCHYLSPDLVEEAERLLNEWESWEKENLENQHGADKA